METLRWVLLLIGVVIIAAVYLTGRHVRRSRDEEQYLDDDPTDVLTRRTVPPPPSRAPEQDADVESLGVALEELGHLIAEREGHGVPERAQSAVSSPVSPREVARDAAPAAPRRAVDGAEPGQRRNVARREVEQFPEGESERAAALPRACERSVAKPVPPRRPVSAPAPSGVAEGSPARRLEEKIVALHVMARSGEHFTGTAIQRAAEAAGLEFGRMKIFHRTSGTGAMDASVFSMANIVEPGWFDPEGFEDFSTPGLIFFLQLPGPLDGPTALESMLTAARRVAGDLEGELRDQTRSVLSKQTVEHLREEIREYQRRQRLVQHRL